MKKLLSLFLSAIMIVTLMFGAVGYADTPEGKEMEFNQLTPSVKGTFTVPIKEVNAGVTVKAYRIIKADYKNGVFGSYIFDENMVPWMKANGYNNYTFDKTGFNNFAKENSDTQRSVYAKLASNIESFDLTPVVKTAKEGEDKIVFDNMDLGQYLLIITGGGYVYNASVATVLPEVKGGKYYLKENYDVTVKAQPVDIKKSILDGTKEVKKVASSLNEEVAYRITADFPNYPTTSKNRVFKITDSLPQGLTYVTTEDGNLDVKVFAKRLSSNKEEEFTKYKLNWVEKDGKKVGFELVPDLSIIHQYAAIRIEYKATVNENAVVGPEGNINTATLVYSNNPTVAGDPITKEDSTCVYTYGIKIFKYTTEDGEQVPLAGAVFSISYRDKNGNYIPVERAGQLTNGSGNGLYVSGNDGYIVLNQLVPGIQYRVEEVQAPGGYVAPNSYTTSYLNVATEGNPAVLTGTLVNELKLEGNADGYKDFSVENSKATLPETGGTGTMIFTVVGIVVMLGAVAYLAIRKRMSSIAK